MRYWWVNQNQSYRDEISCGYLWSPKRNANKARNPFYESMREVAPGDIIFSFRDTRIAALGIARSYCYESPKPTEFGTVGSYWEAIGWKIDVSFRELNPPQEPHRRAARLAAAEVLAAAHQWRWPAERVLGRSRPAVRGGAVPSHRWRSESGEGRREGG